MFSWSYDDSEIIPLDFAEAASDWEGAASEGPSQGLVAVLDPDQFLRARLLWTGAEGGEGEAVRQMVAAFRRLGWEVGNIALFGDLGIFALAQLQADQFAGLEGVGVVAGDRFAPSSQHTLGWCCAAVSRGPDTSGFVLVGPMLRREERPWYEAGLNQTAAYAGSGLKYDGNGGPRPESTNSAKFFRIHFADLGSQEQLRFDGHRRDVGWREMMPVLRNLERQPARTVFRGDPTRLSNDDEAQEALLSLGGERPIPLQPLTPREMLVRSTPGLGLSPAYPSPYQDFIGAAERYRADMLDDEMTRLLNEEGEGSAEEEDELDVWLEAAGSDDDWRIEGFDEEP